MRQTIGVALLCLFCCALSGAQTLVLTGKAMDEQGKPVRDAEVWVRRATTRGALPPRPRGRGGVVRS
jgi:hypothetical protein